MSVFALGADVGPQLGKGCAKLSDIGKHWNEHIKHAQWVACLVSALAMQELGCC